MKTQNKNKLDFKKESIVELNNDQLKEVNGGTSTLCIILIVTVIVLADSH